MTRLQKFIFKAVMFSFLMEAAVDEATTETSSSGPYEILGLPLKTWVSLCFIVVTIVLTILGVTPPKLLYKIFGAIDPTSIGPFLWAAIEYIVRDPDENDDGIVDPEHKERVRTLRESLGTIFKMDKFIEAIDNEESGEYVTDDEEEADD